MKKQLHRKKNENEQEIGIYHARNASCEMVCGYGKKHEDVVKATVKKAFKLFPDYYMQTMDCTFSEDLEQCTIIMSK